MTMAVMDILTLPNPILRKKAQDIKRIGDGERAILADMPKPCI